MRLAELNGKRVGGGGGRVVEWQQRKIISRGLKNERWHVEKKIEHNENQMTRQK